MSEILEKKKENKDATIIIAVGYAWIIIAALGVIFPIARYVSVLLFMIVGAIYAMIAAKMLVSKLTHTCL